MSSSIGTFVVVAILFPTVALVVANVTAGIGASHMTMVYTMIRPPLRKLK